MPRKCDSIHSESGRTVKKWDILIVGVGGQGVLLASELLSNVALQVGYDVKKSEVHGMAQRGGIVSSHVRIGEKIFSPLIPEGRADVLLAFEQAEALRWIHFLASDGTVIINQKKLVPPIALFKGKGTTYPDDPIESIRNRVHRIVLVPADQIARDLGNPRTENTILLGVLSCFLDLPEKTWTRLIESQVPKGTAPVNIKAFYSGIEKGKER
jgi:indolepyruvate ferredoxin oxidoreductase beta subunit